MSDYNNQKKPLKFSKKTIDKAARDIRHGVKGDERLNAIEIIQNFREFHLYPLMLMKNHLSRTANKVSSKIIVARRLKRLPTIINKLERPTLDGINANGIKLTRMQDIAGCRAIVSNISELKALQSRLASSRSVHKITKINDYLKPKESGYGGVHLIYSCYEGLDSDHDWKGSKVEVQLRTNLQHDWATSLEIIDTLENTSLKTSHLGNENWRKFFCLAGQLVAHYENAFTLDDSALYEIRSELFGGPGLIMPPGAGFEKELNVRSLLSKYSLAINIANNKEFHESKNYKDGFFLIQIRIKPERKVNQEKFSIDVKVEFFSVKSSDEAVQRYNEAELDDSVSIAVLVSVNDAKTLHQAYPNYFGSTDNFNKFLELQEKEYETQCYQRAEKLERKIAIISSLLKNKDKLSSNHWQRLKTIAKTLHDSLHTYKKSPTDD